jgi:hypothetical protein
MHVDNTQQIDTGLACLVMMARQRGKLMKLTAAG